MDAKKVIDTKIASIRRRGTTLRGDTQKCAVLIMEHAKETGDCSRALRLVEALTSASERVMLIDWFKNYSPINVTWNKDAGKRRIGYNKPDAKAYNAFNLDGARANNYFDVVKSDDEQTANLLDAPGANTFILALAERMQKRVDKGEVAANDKDNVVSKIAALRLAAVAVAA